MILLRKRPLPSRAAARSTLPKGEGSFAVIAPLLWRGASYCERRDVTRAAEREAPGEVTH